MTRQSAILARRVWDGQGSSVLEDGIVVIRDRRVAAVGPRAALEPQLAPDTPRVELPQSTLMPGLFDMHVHMCDDGWTPRRMLAAGITTVRDTGNNHRRLIQLRAQQQAGQWVGPRLFSFGPLIDASPPFWGHLALPIPETADVEAIVDGLVADGVDGFKTYVRAEAWLVDRVIRRAAIHHKPVTCHLGATSALQALTLGMGCLEHVFCLQSDLFDRDQDWADFKPHSFRLEALAARFVAKKSWFCPTLAVMDVCHGGLQRVYQNAASPTLPAYLRKWLKLDEGGTHGQGTIPDKLVRAAQVLAKMRELVLALHQAGVPLLAGTDNPWVMPGTGLHVELEQLVLSGLSADEVLATATRQAARYLGVEQNLGTIQAGKLADLVAVEGNPLTNIRDMSNVSHVWQEGTLLNRTALLAQAQEIIDQAPAECPPDRPPVGIAMDQGPQAAIPPAAAC